MTIASRISRAVVNASSDDPRHAKEAGLRRGIGGVGNRVADLGEVWVHRALDAVGVDVRRRYDSRRVDALHLLGVGEDVGELFREELFSSRSARGSRAWRCARHLRWSVWWTPAMLSLRRQRAKAEVDVDQSDTLFK